MDDKKFDELTKDIHARNEQRAREEESQKKNIALDSNKPLTKEEAVGGTKEEEIVASGETSADVLKQMQEFLAEYDNQESTIPLNNPYWHIRNRYSVLSEKERLTAENKAAKERELATRK